MATASCATVDSIASYLDQVFQVHTWWAPVPSQFDEIDLWFRGVNDERFRLLPGSIWRANYDEISAVAEFETAVSGSLFREPVDEWEWYFLMQHHGLGTRLLDWSESPLVALYFALANFDPKSGGAPCVWIIDPRALNYATTGEYELIAPGGPFTRHWLPSAIGRSTTSAKFKFDGQDCTNELPLAILPRRHEPRILAQRGVFTIHGINRGPVDDIFQTLSPPDRRITKICVDTNRVEPLMKQLSILGLRSSTLFPDPSHVAAELLRRWA
jgi:hypothetical protein